MRAGGPNCAEAERRANLFAMPRRDRICGPEGRIAQKSGAERVLFVKRGATVLIMLIRKMPLGYAPRMSGRPGRAWPVSGRGLCEGAAGIFLHGHFMTVLVLGKNAEAYRLIANPIAAVDGKIAIFAIIIIAPDIECPA